MKNTIITVTISAIILFGGLALLETHFRNELSKLGWLPKNKNNFYPFDRRISGYTVSENTPNFQLSAYNEHFQPSSASTDSNGFRTDGTLLRKEKAPNTIRIFITGGSTAWGSIESHDVMKDTTYPEGCYDYNTSIAGKLKAILNSKYPQLKFEVINAAVVQHCFHQNFALYFEKLHDYDPDIVINMDGFNDKGNFVGFQNDGDPYPNSMDKLEEELELATISRLPQRPYMLAYYNFKYEREQALPVKKMNVGKKRGPKNNTTIAHETDQRSYELVKPYIRSSKKMLWLIDSYEHQLRSDSVFSIFCLQPTLQRRVYQKELSAKEMQFRNFLDNITASDTVKRRNVLSELSKSNPIWQTIESKIGAEIFWLDITVNSYFYNDLSPIIESRVQSAGGEYVDINKAMTKLGSDKEFYVDYCHLTPFGNEFVAELLLKKVEIYLAQKKRVDIPKL